MTPESKKNRKKFRYSIYFKNGFKLTWKVCDEMGVIGKIINSRASM